MWCKYFCTYLRYLSSHQRIAYKCTDSPYSGRGLGTTIGAPMVGGMVWQSIKPFSAEKSKKESKDERGRAARGRECAHSAAGNHHNSHQPAARFLMTVLRSKTIMSPSTADSKRLERLVRLIGLALLPSAGRHTTATYIFLNDSEMRSAATDALGARGDGVETVRFLQTMWHILHSLYMVGV